MTVKESVPQQSHSIVVIHSLYELLFNMKPNLISFFIFLFDHLRHEESGLPHQCAHWFAMTGVGCGAAILRAQQKAPLIHRVVRMGLLHAAAALRRDGSVSASPFFLSPASPVLPEFRYSTPCIRGKAWVRCGFAGDWRCNSVNAAWRDVGIAPYKDGANFWLRCQDPSTPLRCAQDDRSWVRCESAEVRRSSLPDSARAVEDASPYGGGPVRCGFAGNWH